MILSSTGSTFESAISFASPVFLGQCMRAERKFATPFDATVNVARRVTHLNWTGFRGAGQSSRAHQNALQLPLHVNTGWGAAPGLKARLSDSYRQSGRKP